MSSSFPGPVTKRNLTPSFNVAIFSFYRVRALKRHWILNLLHILNLPLKTILLSMKVSITDGTFSNLPEGYLSNLIINDKTI